MTAATQHFCVSPSPINKAAVTNFIDLFGNKNFFDISRRVSNQLLVYPGDPALAMQPTAVIGPDCPCNVMGLGNWSTHTGTHVDVPFHFFADGKSLDDLPLSRFCGAAVVIEVGDDVVMPAHLGDVKKLSGKNVLFKTRNSRDYSDVTFNDNHVYIGVAAAEALATARVNMVGIDYLSVDRVGDDAFPAHMALLGNDVLILENCDLAAVSAGEYLLQAYPLRIEKGDGSPVRAVLLK